MAHKTGFTLSKTVYAYLKTQLDLDTLIDLKALFTAKIGGRQAKAVMDLCDRISAFGSYRQYLGAFA
jgi:hypothetical protein